MGAVTGQYVKSDDHGVGIAIAAGAVGACLIVVISRVVGSAAFAGYALSAIVSIGGAIGGVFAARHFMKSKPVPVRARARR
ncbi:MAG: hypothetical protein NVSMB68_09220 [Thermoanaerobaculia bacterium]